MAGITHLKQFQKPALRGLVDETIQDSIPTLADRFLPTEETYERTFAYDIIKSSKYIAAMIGEGSEPPVVDRDKVASMHGEIAQMGLKDIVTYEELVAIHQARNNLEKAAVIDKITLKGVNLVDAVLRRIQVTKMEALTKGVFKHDANNVKIDIDFGIPEENKKALTGDNAWTNKEKDIIGDLLDWVQQYEDTNGESPEVIYVSREIQALMLTNETLITEISGKDSGRTRLSKDELNLVLDGYGLPPVEVVVDRKTTVRKLYTGENEVIEFFPSNRVVMLSEGIGKYLLGPTLENDFQPGIYLGANDKIDPIRSELEVVAAGFPMIEQPHRIFHADVFVPTP